MSGVCRHTPEKAFAKQESYKQAPIRYIDFKNSVRQLFSCLVDFLYGKIHRVVSMLITNLVCLRHIYISGYFLKCFYPIKTVFSMQTFSFEKIFNFYMYCTEENSCMLLQCWFYCIFYCIKYFLNVYYL